MEESRHRDSIDELLDLLNHLVNPIIILLMMIFIVLGAESHKVDDSSDQSCSVKIVR